MHIHMYCELSCAVLLISIGITLNNRFSEHATPEVKQSKASNLVILHDNRQTVKDDLVELVVYHETTL